jgi:signal transduction histidine kinase
LLEESLTDHARKLELVTRRLLHVHENERKVLARELHEQIGQLLAAIKMFLDSALKLPLDTEMKAKLQTGVPFILEAIQHVRNMSSKLRPSVLDDLGLLLALRSLASDVQEDSGVPVNVETSGSLDGLDPELESTCFRVAQSALTNAVVHGRPTAVKLSLRAEKGELTLAIEDNGKGFDVDQVMASPDGAIGLTSMIERTKATNGRLSIRSTPGKGTCVEAVFEMKPGAGEMPSKQ